MYEAARTCSGQVVMVDQNFRWRPHIQALRRGLREGLVGRVGHVALESRQQILRKTVNAWREKMPEPFLLDYAIHHEHVRSLALPLAVVESSRRGAPVEMAELLGFLES